MPPLLASGFPFSLFSFPGFRSLCSLHPGLLYTTSPYGEVPEFGALQHTPARAFFIKSSLARRWSCRLVLRDSRRCLSLSRRILIASGKVCNASTAGYSHRYVINAMTYPVYRIRNEIYFCTEAKVELSLSIARGNTTNHAQSHIFNLLHIHEITLTENAPHRCIGSVRGTCGNCRNGHGHD